MHTVHSDYAETAYSYHGVKVVAVNHELLYKDHSILSHTKSFSEEFKCATYKLYKT